MPPIIPVYFDYASSLCYIAFRLTERLEVDLGVVMVWRPVSISVQYPHWKHGTPLGVEVRTNIERVSRETGIPIRIPPRWLDSRLALEGAVVAQQTDRFRDYHQAVFSAAYERGEDIGDSNILASIAAAVGVPDGYINSPTAGGGFTPALEAHLAEARELGVIGYPTFLLGEFPLTGIQPYETMRLLIARYLQRRGDDRTRMQ